MVSPSITNLNSLLRSLLSSVEDQIDMSHQFYNNLLCPFVLYRNPLNLSCLLVLVLFILLGCGLSQDITLIDHHQPAILTSIQINPSEIDLPLCLIQQFTATGSFSDGSSQDLT